MNLASLYFSPHGRISRTAYWVASLPLIAPQILFGLQAYDAATLGEAAPWLILALAVMVPSVMISIKRCHDRNKTGWFLLPILISDSSLLLEWGILSPGLALLIDFGVLLYSLWLFVELSFLRGTECSNQYGPDPLVATPDCQPPTLAAICCVGVICGGAGVAYAIADRLAPQATAYAPAPIVEEGTVVDLAVPSAAAYRVARHAFAAEAAIWHSLEILEAGIAGALPRDQAARDASATVVLARNEMNATLGAVEDLEARAAAYLNARDLEDMRAGLQAWAEGVGQAASLAASTVPLITAAEVVPGNLTYGLVPTMMHLQEARAQAIEQLGRVISPAMLEDVVVQHFVNVSAALGDITKLVPAFVDRRGATADLEATAERIWNQTLERLSPTYQHVMGLASSFQRRESEIRESIGVPLMEDAFAPVISSYEATGGELAVKPTNAFIGLRARLLEAAHLGKRPEAVIVPLLRAAREALIAVARQAELGETRMGYFLNAVGEAGV